MKPDTRDTTQSGSGPPLLLINGYAASKEDWDPVFLDALAGQSTVICPDNAGIGGSRSVAQPLTVDSMVTGLVELLDTRDLTAVEVVGWSMGGFLAQALAAAEPARVGRLGLLSTDPEEPKMPVSAGNGCHGPARTGRHARRPRRSPCPDPWP